MTENQFAKKIDKLVTYVKAHPECTPASACKHLRFDYPEEMLKFRGVANEAIKQKLIRRKGAGRGTVYIPKG